VRNPIDKKQRCVNVALYWVPLSHILSIVGMAPMAGAGKLTTLSSIKNTPRWSMRGRCDDTTSGKKSAASPGPGAYGVPVTEKTKYSRPPSAMFGTSNRDPGQSRQSSLPGPGTYMPKEIGNETPKIGFGTSNRGSESARSRTPGPGTYDVRGNMAGVTVSFSARHREGNARSNTPGPGAYGAPKFDRFEATPKFGFGTATRPGLGGNATTPGPGSYAQLGSIGQNALMPTSPSYTMKPRRDPVGAKGNGNPGPSGPFTLFGP